jgi:hypothetical protein
MVIVDEEQWPVLVIHLAGAMTEDSVDAYNAALDRAIGRGEPFAAAMVSTPEYLSAPPNNVVANKTMKWLKANKPALRATCRGIAMIVPDAEHRAMMEPKVAKQGEQVYGCPTRVFATLDDAQLWLRQQLTTTAQAREA